MGKKRNLLIGLITGVLLAMLLISALFVGMLIGAKRENRSFPFWERRHIFGDYVPGKFEEHGVVGTVDSLGASTLVVKDRTGALKTILVDNETKIRRNRMPINFPDIKVGERVIILGNPEEKESAVNAKVIRVIGDFRKESTSSATW